MSTGVTKGQLALIKAVRLAGGYAKAAKAVDVSYQAIQKWISKGFPRTEWTGETNYADQLSKLIEGGVTKEELHNRTWATTKQVEASKKSSSK